MGEGISRRSLLGSATAWAGLGSAAFGAPPDGSLRPVQRGGDHYKRAVPSVDAILRETKLTGNLSFAVARTGSGDWLECHNEQQDTPPASVTKAVTALYALETLGPAHEFETRIGVTGAIVNGQVQGDLILIGGGDPTLDTNGLAELAAQLKAAGVRAVKGRFKVYVGALPALRQIDPAQPDHVGYNPAISGIALNYNRVHFEWKRSSNGYAVSMDARSDKYRPDVAMAAMRVGDRRTPVYTFEDRAGLDYWTVARGALGNGGSRWLPVRQPGLYAGDVFATMARSQGIVLGKAHVTEELPRCDIVVTRKSGNLRAILRDMLKYSTNITAEMVGLAASRARLGTVKNLRASAAEMNRWAIGALGMRGPKLVDHSGLGDESALTALDMARALVQVENSGLRPILKRIVMRDEKGRPVKAHPITVEAKTGTLNFVSTLAGYMTAKDGEIMAFAIFAAHPDERAKISRAERERPAGARGWNRRAKRAQQALIERWGVLYGA